MSTLQILSPRSRDLGDFAVRRVLPSGNRNMIGPFIFFDHMGPATFPPGKGIDVRPHPHINLATVTYLFSGNLFHRDSVGAAQNIEPGAVNWMTAGRGIVHSERSSPESRAGEMTIHGIQTWIALPAEHEEIEPSFHHHPKETLPSWTEGDWQLRLIAGSAFGKTSPVTTYSPMFYVDCHAEGPGELSLPPALGERAVYCAEGSARIDGTLIEVGQMAIGVDAEDLVVQTAGPARLMLLGGDAFREPRHIWWNFVSSRLERIEQAKEAWRDGQFAMVDGDPEFIPLPEK